MLYPIELRVGPPALNRYIDAAFAQRYFVRRSQIRQPDVTQCCQIGRSVGSRDYFFHNRSMSKSPSVGCSSLNSSNQ